MEDTKKTGRVSIHHTTSGTSNWPHAAIHDQRERSTAKHAPPKAKATSRLAIKARALPRAPIAKAKAVTGVEKLRSVRLCSTKFYSVIFK